MTASPRPPPPAAPTHPAAPAHPARPAHPALPPGSRYVVIGAGIHGLSAAWHLARELKAPGLGGGRDTITLDKRRVGAGASGTARGGIRPNHFQPPIPALFARVYSLVHASA